MFASPKFPNIPRSKSNAMWQHDKIDEKEKLSKLLLTRCMKNFDLIEPNIKIAEEIVKFVNRKAVNENDIKEFDNKIKTIVTDIKSNLERKRPNDIKVSNNINNPDNEINELTPILNDTVDKVNEASHELIDSIKLPKVQSKVVNVTGSTNRPDSRSSKASMMSGASKLSKLSNHDQYNYQIKQWLKNNLFIKEPDTNHQQSNLPYDINDYDSMMKYDLSQYNEEIRMKKQDKRELQNNFKRDLEKQMEEKQNKDIEALRIDRELEEYLNSTKIDNEKAENALKEMLKKQYIDDLNSIIKEEAIKKYEAIKSDRRSDKELINRYISDLNKEKDRNFLKKQIIKDFYQDLKNEVGKRKEIDKIKLEKEKEDEAKWFEESQLLIDKQDKIRRSLMPIIEENTKQPSKKIIEAKEDHKIEKNYNKIANTTKKPVYVRNEESILKQILIENKKKYYELEDKIKEIEEKIKYNQRDSSKDPFKDVNKNNSNSNSILNLKFENNGKIKPVSHLKDSVSMKKSIGENFRLVRPSNSLVGDRKVNVSSSHNLLINKKKEKNNSEFKLTENQSIGNLKINSNRYSVIKNNYPSLFTTQI